MEAVRIVYETARKESHNALKIVGMSGHSRTTGHTREARMTEDRDRKKTAIVATAVRLFTERGFHGTPTSLIAREAGISNGTLFHYFPTKEELINFAYFDIEVVLKPLCREGDTPSRSLHRVAIPDGKPFHPPCPGYRSEGRNLGGECSDQGVWNVQDLFGMTSSRTGWRRRSAGGLTRE
jgi:hypothetical protein